MKILGCAAVVVGAARGVGLAYVHALLDKGAKVCFCDVLVDEGKAREQELRNKYGDEKVFFVKCDVSVQKDVDDLFAKALDCFSRLDIVVNNAAIIHEFQWQKCFEVNVFGVIRVTEAGLKHMGKDKGGRGGAIVTTASVSGLYPDYWAPVYCATKHAIVAFTRAWAMEENYKSHGVRLNLICPGSIDTKFIENVTPERVYHAEQKRIDISKEIVILPSDVAKVLITLLENDEENGTALQIVADKIKKIDFIKFSAD